MDKSTPRDPAPDPAITIEHRIIDEYGEQIGAYGLAIYMVIKRHLTEDTTHCQASYTTIARTLRIDRGTVSRYVQKLKALHLISPSLRCKDDGSHAANHVHVSPVPRPSGYLLVSYGASLRGERG